MSLQQQIEISFDELVIDDKQNMRTRMESVEDLQESIKAVGQINPVTVYKDGEKYRVVAGFRRSHAMKNLKSKTIKVVVRDDLTPEQRDILQIEENTSREDTNVFETAQAMKRIMDKYKFSQKELASKMRRSEAYVSNYLGLFDLPDRVIDFARDGRLNVAQVRFLKSYTKFLTIPQMNKLATNILGTGPEDLKDIKETLDNKYKTPETKEATTDTTHNASESSGSQTKGVHTAKPTNEESGDVEDIEYQEERVASRSRPQIVSKIMDLSDIIEQGTDDGRGLQVNSWIDALQWVLGDNGIELN